MPNIPNHPLPPHTGPPMPPGSLPNVYPPIPNVPLNLQQVPIIHPPNHPPPQPGNFANYKPPLPHPAIPILPHTGPPIPIGAQPPPFYPPRSFVNHQLPTGPPPNGHPFPPNI